MLTVEPYIIDFTNEHYLRFFVSLHHLTKPYTSPDFHAEPVAEEDKSTFTWLIHMYPPVHNAGAEWTAHSINEYLINTAGCKVNVVLNSATTDKYKQVHIVDRRVQQSVDYAVRHCAVILSHLDQEPMAVKTALAARRPIVLVIHNSDRKPYLHEFMRILPENIYLIHNSYWLKDHYSHFEFPSIVVFPPVNWKEYYTITNHEFVTLINLNENKGGRILIDIAKKLPHTAFAGVKGAYSDQILDTRIRNIKYIDNTPYIKNIYAKTDILLIPSGYESWGRVAIEAMSSGIPVIAHTTPGLIESCGSAGIFCDRNDIEAWVLAIKRLKTDREYYAERSAACLARAKELDPLPQLENAAKWLKEIKWKN